MSRGRKLLLAAGLAAATSLAALGGAAARNDRSAETGVTSKTILIGGTAPLTGIASGYASVARGAAAWFKYVNSHGGVRGRKIDYRYLDDQYDPSKTVQQTRRLVQQDKVFAIFNSLGTANNIAVRDFLNELDVPQLFVGSGANTFGADYKKYPWTLGYLPSYSAEGEIYGRYLARARPRAKIAILVEEDGYGEDLIRGLRRGLGRRASQIVARQGYDPTAPDVRSEIAKLKSSGADTLMLFATPQFAIQGFNYAYQLGWHPHVIVDQISSASNLIKIAQELTNKRQTIGTISIVFLKDPSNPRWKRDRVVALYRRVLKRYFPRANAKDVYHAYGMAVAYTMTDVLRRAGRNPTRASAMRAALHLRERNPFALPGMLLATKPTDRFPIKQAQLERWTGSRWVAFGKLVRAHG